MEDERTGKYIIFVSIVNDDIFKTWVLTSMFQMKTVSVALVLCLNVGVDPPDIVKTQPCARLECWIGNIIYYLIN